MANIIKQLIDSDGNNIYPIAYAQGGVKMEVVWQNPNPTSALASTTTTLSKNLDDYDLFLVYSAIDKNRGGYKIEPIFANGVSYILNFASGSAGEYYRTIKLTSPNSLIISGGSYNGSSNNDALVVQAVYGLKMPYIVPTTVQGLQYIEV